MIKAALKAGQGRRKPKGQLPADGHDDTVNSAQNIHRRPKYDDNQLLQLCTARSVFSVLCGYTP